MPKIIGLILGYGIPPDILVDGNYRRYLNYIVDNFAISEFIICGGHTNDHFPEKTEASEIERLLKPLVPGAQLKTWLCPEGITSWDNLESTRPILLEMRPNIIFVFCEKTRNAKIKLLAKVLLKDFRVCVIGVDFDQSKTWKKALVQVCDFGLTVLRIGFPQVGKFKNWLQRRHISRPQ